MKSIAILVVLVACFATASFGGTIRWGYGGDLGAAYVNGWLVELIEDVDQDGIDIAAMWDDHSITGDDTFISTPVTTALVAGKAGVVWGAPFTSPGASLQLGDHVYTVIYNSSTFMGATMYQVVDAAPTPLPGFDVDTDYILSAAPNGAWTAMGPVPDPVPEPGTIALLGLGLATLAVRRKRR